MKQYLTVADLHSKILDARLPWWSKSFQFHAVFGKFWQNRWRPLGSWRPPREILDPPLYYVVNADRHNNRRNENYQAVPYYPDSVSTSYSIKAASIWLLGSFGPRPVADPGFS